MRATKIRISLMTLALMGIGALFCRQQQQATDLRKQGDALRERVEEMAPLREENQQLSGQLKSAAEASEATSSELARLRAQIVTLRQLERQNASRRSEQQSHKATAARQPDDSPFERFFGPGSEARVHDAKVWGFALMAYAGEHQDQFPASLQEASLFLGPDDLTPEQKAQTALTADRFEILYQGRREDMTNPPPEGAIMLREKQPWRTAKGEWARAYVYGSGAAIIHTEPDGNFEKWEGPRIPKLARRDP
jgi:hypothetical protein